MTANNRASFLAICFLAAAIIGCTQTSEQTNNNFNVAGDQGNAAVQIEAGGGEVKTEDPAVLVADLYKQHDAQKSPFFQKDRGRIDKYFAKPLSDLIFRDATNPIDQAGAIGADPLYDGQDFEIKNFAVGKSDVEGDKATVPVTFENFGEKKKVTVSLTLANNAWKISDIRYDHGASLLAMFREAYGDGKTNAPPIKNVPGEFEGTYRVGETTCTVKPAKSAFEVRWAKGSGVETFRFEGRDAKGINFVSEPEPGKYNVFTFTDENYDSGTFSRPDGKVFKVSRAR
ncbi:MAG: DUF3828 domain-containing protein [Acidobacteria bacterium]|nr:DUF3828 domain-containing protein [Acidobacteriota bacterium]